tara:strand:- start:422 stop:622 length:201 start_codon:yes stop_codon:yes gene_type:complete
MLVAAAALAWIPLPAAMAGMAAVDRAVLDMTLQQTDKTAAPTQAAAAAANGFIQLACAAGMVDQEL